MVRFSSPNSRPCSPACCMAAPRTCDSPSLLLVTATPASDPGSHHPGYPICTLGAGECARQRPRAARRSAHSARPARLGSPAKVLRADGVEKFAELLDLVLLLVGDRDPGLVQ